MKIWSCLNVLSLNLQHISFKNKYLFLQYIYDFGDMNLSKFKYYICMKIQLSTCKIDIFISIAEFKIFYMVHFYCKNCCSNRKQKTIIVKVILSMKQNMNEYVYIYGKI